MRRRDLIKNYLETLKLYLLLSPLFGLTFIELVGLIKVQVSNASNPSKNIEDSLKDFVNEKDFDTLQEAFNKASSLGRQLRLQPKKTYIISKTITVLLNGKNFSIDGQGSTFVIKDSSRLISSDTFNNISARTLITINSEVKDLSKSPSLVIKNLNVINFDVRPVLGFSLEGTYNILEINNFNAKNLSHSAMWNRTELYEQVSNNIHGTALAILKNVVIKNCTLEKCGADQNAAIHINCPRALIVDSCNFYDSTGYALRVNGGALDTIPNQLKGSKNVLIINCLFKTWAEKYIGLQVTKTCDVRIKSNRFLNRPGNGTDNAIDVFNCQSVQIIDNSITGSKGLFVGHADLGLTTAQNLVGTANINIFNNLIYNTLSRSITMQANTPIPKDDWGAITIGGDGTVDGPKHSYNFTIKKNRIINNLGVSDQSAIHSFICQNVFIEDNYVQGLATFYSEYFSKFIFINKNIIRDVPVLLEMLGEDWSTIPTRKYCNNILLGKSQEASKAVQMSKKCKI